MDQRRCTQSIKDSAILTVDVEGGPQDSDGFTKITSTYNEFSKSGAVPQITALTSQNGPADFSYEFKDGLSCVNFVHYDIDGTAVPARISWIHKSLLPGEHRHVGDEAIVDFNLKIEGHPMKSGMLDIDDTCYPSW